MRCLLGLIVILAFLPVNGFAAKMTERVEAAAKNGQYTYVMFYRADNAATEQMANTIRSHVAETGEKTTWAVINIQDRAESRLVKRFDATRIPLPAVFSVAPNGAVTGVYRQRVSQEQLTNSMLTPMYSDMVRALQSQKIAVVCLMPATAMPIPTGVAQLHRDADFKGKLHQVNVYATDSSEADFFNRMQVDRNLTTPVVMMFAPPGTHLGTFNASVKGQELAQELHKSGKCNCTKCQKKKK